MALGEKEVMTVEQVADHLSVSMKAVRTWIKQGNIAAFRAGRLLRVRRQSVADFMSRNELVNPAA